MKKSIKLYNRANCADLLELLISAVDPDGKKPEITEKLRTDFQNIGELQRFEMLNNLIREVKAGELYCIRIDQLEEVLAESGNEFWNDVQATTMLIHGLEFYHQENSFLFVEIGALKKDLSSGMGIHSIGDLIIAAYRVETEGMEFLKPYYPEFIVAEPFIGCFSPDGNAEAFTAMLALELKSLAGSFYDRLTQKGVSIEVHMVGVYKSEGLLVHRKALFKSFEQSDPSDRDNEHIANSFDFGKLRRIYHAFEKKPLTLESLKASLSAELI